MSRNSDYSKVKGRKGERTYSQLYDDMSKSKAFKRLTGNELKVLMQFISDYNGGNNGILDLSYEKANKELGLARATFSTALKGLLKKGFIVVGVYGGKNILSRYAVTCYPVNDCRNKDGVRMHNLPVSPVATNDWREYNKTLANEDKEK